jgi:hypothetical protein
VVSTNCSGIRLYLCVIVIFICVSSDPGEDRLQGIKIMILCDCEIYF